MKIIDVHTHAFPDFLAAKALRSLTGGSSEHAPPHLNGTVDDLLRSMDRAGIDISVVASIATAEKQVPDIFAWSRQIASDRIMPFPSIWPFSADVADQVRRIADAGFKGIKLHPLYQNFEPLDDRLLPVYQMIADAGLVVLFHSGDDLGFPGDRRCMPHIMLQILDHVPALKMILAHLGGFRQARDFANHGIDSSAYVECSFSIPDQANDKAFDEITHNHVGKVMFGTDSPWNDQTVELARLSSVMPDKNLLSDILWNNAARLFALPA